MAIKINSNGQSLAAQRQVAQTGDALSRVFERLSSGQRINRASDDAAGLAIADTLNTKSRVFTAGVRNLNDGISLLSVADAAVSSLTDITIRLKELAEQSANGVYSTKQRQALDNEAQALSKEFTRITQSTSFNGLNLFNGSVQGLRLQAGYGADGGIASDLGGFIGSGTFSSVLTLGGAGVNKLLVGDVNNDGSDDIITQGMVQLGSGNGSFTQTSTVAISNNAFLADIDGDGNLDLVSNDSSNITLSLGTGNGAFKSATSIVGISGLTGMSASDLDGDGILDIVAVSSSTATIQIFKGVKSGTFSPSTSYSIGPVTGAVAIGDINGDGILDIASAYAESNDTGHLATLLGSGGGSFNPVQTKDIQGLPTDVLLKDINSDGKLDFILSSNGSSAIIGINDGSGSFSGYGEFLDPNYSPGLLSAVDANGDGKIDLVAYNDGIGLSTYLGNGDGTFAAPLTVFPNYAMFQAVGDFNGDGVADLAASTGFNTAEVLFGDTKKGVSAISDFSLNSQQGSKAALSTFTRKLSLLSSQRGQIGAFQSRVTTAINVLQSSTENFKAAESRIRDTDVAKDTAQLARLQILQQAGISVLSQANLQPQIALKLLQS